ncbi:MAG: hypothetical protein IIW10_02765, partial [Spirochaetaceae bacterium]|nr:hypothetical protein [Spirochaetaceae bacterium]
MSAFYKKISRLPRAEFCALLVLPLFYVFFPMGIFPKKIYFFFILTLWGFAAVKKKTIPAISLGIVFIALVAYIGVNSPMQSLFPREQVV